MDKYLKLIKEVPLFPRGAIYFFEFETGHVYRIDHYGRKSESPLRSPLAGYLWLLMTEPGYFQPSEYNPDIPTPNGLRSLETPKS